MKMPVIQPRYTKNGRILRDVLPIVHKLGQDLKSLLEIFGKIKKRLKMGIIIMLDLRICLINFIENQ